MIMAQVVVLAVLAVLGAAPPEAMADDVRSCFKCRGRDACLRPKHATVEICSPDVKRCVTKFTVSKVTGVQLSEQYCGSPEVGEIQSVPLEDRCYPHDYHHHDRRTITTFCYCSYDLCNASSIAFMSWWVMIVVVLVGVRAMTLTLV